MQVCRIQLCKPLLPIDNSHKEIFVDKEISVKKGPSNWYLRKKQENNENEEMNNYNNEEREEEHMQNHNYKEERNERMETFLK